VGLACASKARTKSEILRRSILTIIGTRPEAIKLAPVILELQRWPGHFISRVCTTTQHRELLDQALSSFGIKTDYDLRIMSPDQSLSQVAARAIEGLDRVFTLERPDFVLVQGDTTSAFCGALTAFYHRIKFGHVEAGLRTNNKYAPFPEEMNRRLVSQLADYHFAPTERAKRALIAEGVAPARVLVTGNTIIDALCWMRERVNKELPKFPPGLLEALDSRQVVLVTAHRRESFGEGLENICRAICQVADAFPDVIFVYPVHLNPRVREPVNRILGGHKRICLIDPLPYDSFLWLMNCAKLVLTDSGGIQEESASLGKPVLVMRETTERPEAIDAGNARLVGVRQEQIVKELVQLLRDDEQRAAMSKVSDAYGDGKACRRIVQTVARSHFVSRAALSYR
jgi:UDP-N-acetylglucosamine 2-epimerase (non-hydrolysing)